ncbi:MAG: hypothetical protein ABIB71_05400 [Candidatus Woesearchaeota archaeon]
MIGKILLMLILLCSFAQAAVIHGNIYDISLELQENIIVEVDSSPKQTMVAKGGSYSFELPEGKYTITARSIEEGEILSSAEEFIEVNQDGNYVLDLILFESFEEDEALLEEAISDVDTSIIEEDKLLLWPFITSAIILIALIIVLCKIRKKKAPIEEDPYLGKMISFIKKEGGRATQKEIRKALGLSEAKISLMVAQLEHEGKLKKIKKGRGNIILLT